MISVIKDIEEVLEVRVGVGNGVEFNGSSDVTADVDTVDSVTNEYEVVDWTLVDVELEIPSEVLLLLVLENVLLGIGVE